MNDTATLKHQQADTVSAGAAAETKVIRIKSSTGGGFPDLTPLRFSKRKSNCFGCC
jgi:hypothetical protein